MTSHRSIEDALEEGLNPPPLTSRLGYTTAWLNPVLTPNTKWQGWHRRTQKLTCCESGIFSKSPEAEAKCKISVQFLAFRIKRVYLCKRTIYKITKIQWALSPLYPLGTPVQVDAISSHQLLHISTQNSNDHNLQS